MDIQKLLAHMLMTKPSYPGPMPFGPQGNFDNMVMTFKLPPDKNTYIPQEIMDYKSDPSRWSQKT